MEKRGFINPRAGVPPGGVWFFRLGDDHVETPIYDIAVRKVWEILTKHGIRDVQASDALAEYMCPQMPEWFCTGVGASSPVINGNDARKNAFPYLCKQMVPADETIRRMERCMACKRHRRDFCLHCQGHDRWIYDQFDGRRVQLQADDASGCCECAKTFEAVIASVSYDKNEPVWEGAPDTCWRYSHE